MQAETALGGAGDQERGAGKAEGAPAEGASAEGAQGEGVQGEGAPAEGGAGARPVSAGERLTLLDTLRGFALGGVFLSNLYVWHSGRAFLPPERIKELSADPVNMAIGMVLGFTLFNKAMTVFTFLFGLGFMIQVERAEARGEAAGRWYTRRLLVLLGIAACHLSFLWYGDILSTYALVGFGLLLFRRASAKALLGWGVGLLLVSEVAADFVRTWLPPLLNSPEELAEVKKAQEAWNAQLFADLTSSSYATLVAANVKAWWWMLTRPGILIANAGVLGKFLIGAYFGRRRLFHDVTQHRQLFRRMLGWGLLAGSIGGGVGLWLRYAHLHDKIGPDSLLPKIVSFPARELGTLGMAAFYIAAVALLYQGVQWRRVLSWIAPAGQMALTNYLSQSALALMIFTGVGFGLLGQLNSLGCVVLVAVLFTGQVIVSRLWLTHFRFGPAEWVWRSLTYGKAQPMRRNRATATGGVTGVAVEETGRSEG
ncbi:DUF418 domain-containing protein [Chondromyces crocatus]|uniref:DUF418 domain-containing protein n=1 Tax=Chondromyces crocatus TaxID=52 RepID=A0A0K1EQZ0_CHOCO|nr:DUF418 domain-containing protein [Chondromyces crocatus]AKT43261.1 uncharacterized protein CMC5_074920 [Chondromyces crocatus]